MRIASGNGTLPAFYSASKLEPRQKCYQVSLAVTTFLGLNEKLTLGEMVFARATSSMWPRKA